MRRKGFSNDDIQLLKDAYAVLFSTDLNFKQAKEKITELITKLNLPVKFKELGIKSPEDIELIIKNGFNPERVKNNPRLLTESKLRKILSQL